MLIRRAFTSLSMGIRIGGAPLPSPAFFLWRAPTAAATVSPSFVSSSAVAPPCPLQLALVPASTDFLLVASCVADQAATTGTGDLPSWSSPLSLRGPNSREPRKSNHGARPCSSIRRRRKYKTRVNDHPYIPLSKQKQKKGMDF